MSAASPLRPLRVGEVLDRSIHIVALRPMLFAIVQAIFSIPSFAFGFKTNAADSQHLLFVMHLNSNDVLWHHADAFEQARSLVLYVAINSLQTAISYVAVEAVASGAPVTLRSAIVTGLRRTPRVAACAAAFAALGIVWLATIFVVAFVAKLEAPQIGSRLDIEVLLAIVATIAAIFLTYPACVIEFAMVAAGCEGTGLRRSFAASARRLGSPQLFGRGLAITAVVMLIMAATWGASSLLSAFAMLADRSGLFSNLIGLVGEMLSSCFILALLPLASRDLRVRVEGLDLDVAATAVVAG